jgi:hypothetical protein
MLSSRVPRPEAPRRTSPPTPARLRSSAKPPRTASHVGPPALTLGPSPASPVPASIGPGEPLLPAIRAALEPVLEVPLDHVRVHTDPRASEAAKGLGAHAFAYGPHIFLGSGQSPSNLQLMAHEVAHVVQQQGGPVVQRSAPGQNDAHEREAQQASASAVRGERFTVRERTTPRVQRFGLGAILDYFADKANLIPGFRMFTIVLGVNPMNMSRVERSAANIMRAVVEFIPGGALITEALDKYGVFEKVGGWVEEQIRGLGMVGSAFKQAIGTFLDSLGLSDILHPGDVWDRAKRIFTEPIDRLINFAKGLITGILKFIKDAILMPLAKLAEGTRGWDLLIAVLGKNPITGEAVPRTAETLIGGFMKLIGEEEVWENIKKANALARAWAWFQGALDGLLGFVREIPSLFIQALKALEIADIVLLPRAFMKVGSVFGGFIVQFLTWAGNSVWNLLQIIFEVVAPGAMPYLKKVGAAFKRILKNPIAFVGNLVKAGKQGFQQFADRIGTHLKAAFLEWLTGSLEGVYIPKSFDFREILKFVLSVLGLTWQNIRQKLVKVLGEPVVKGLETTFDIVVTLVKEGPAAAWEKIKEQLTNLKDMVMQGIMDFIVETVVKKAVAKIIGFLIPGAAFIQAIITIYDTIMVFIDKLKKIIQVVTAFLDSIVDIANGVITAAANKVETTLAGLLVLAISFLAGFASLGKIAAKVMDIINKKIREPISKALDKAIDWIVATAKKLFGAAKAKLVAWWKMKVAVKGEDESHQLFFRGEQASAQVTISSAPMALEDFLADQEKTASNDQKKLIGGIRKKLDGIKKLIKQSKPADPNEKLQKDIEDAMNALGTDLVQLLSTGGMGSESNPAPLDYEKRNAAAYPVFYLGLGKAKNFTQATLKDRMDTEEYKDKIFRYLPTGSLKTPGNEETLGLASASQIEVGRKIEFEKKGTRGGGVGRFKSVVSKYGLTPSDAGWDVDHVVELQIGGEDIFQNLWPLPKGENRSSGSIIKSATVKGANTTVSDLFSERKKKKKTLWLIITSTHQR